MRYFLSLGSNLGNKRRNLSLALKALQRAGVKVLRVSSVYRTQPVDFTAQPWFYNQVVHISAPLTPPELHDLTLRIEKELGRKPLPGKGPRAIDIDILLAENQAISTRRLVIPHPRLPLRNFVLVPLAEIAPRTVHPLLKRKIADLKKASTDPSAVRRLTKKKRPALNTRSR